MISVLKPPRPIPGQLNPTIFAFPPNRDILGGTAYFIQNPSGNLLIDCPAWTEETISWLNEKGGVRRLILTHRGDFVTHDGCAVRLSRAVLVR